MYISMPLDDWIGLSLIIMMICLCSCILGFIFGGIMYVIDGGLKHSIIKSPVDGRIKNFIDDYFIPAFNTSIVICFIAILIISIIIN